MLFGKIFEKVTCDMKEFVRAQIFDNTLSFKGLFWTKANQTKALPYSGSYNTREF